MTRHPAAPRWTEAEEKIARELLEAFAPPEEFLQKLNRTKAASRVHIRVVDDFAFRIERRERDAARRRGDETYRASLKGRIQPQMRGVPTPEMVEAAQQRSLAPRSLTAMIFGDPAPGHSALDRRQVQP
jgi:hypothetical protein